MSQRSAEALNRHDKKLWFSWYSRRVHGYLCYSTCVCHQTCALAVCGAARWEWSVLWLAGLQTIRFAPAVWCKPWETQTRELFFKCHCVRTTHLDEVHYPVNQATFSPYHFEPRLVTQSVTVNQAPIVPLVRKCAWEVLSILSNSTVEYQNAANDTVGTSGVHTLIIYGSSEQLHVYW